MESLIEFKIESDIKPVTLAGQSGTKLHDSVYHWANILNPTESFFIPKELITNYRTPENANQAIQRTLNKLIEFHYNRKVLLKFVTRVIYEKSNQASTDRKVEGIRVWRVK